MELSATQNSFGEIKNIWNHYWNKEIIRRPPVIASIPKSSEGRDCSKEYYSHRYAFAVQGKHETMLDFIKGIVKTRPGWVKEFPFSVPITGRTNLQPFLEQT